MDDLIRQIIGIEDKAQEVMREAREANASLASRVNRDAVKLQDDIETQMKEKSSSLKQLELEEAENRISEINGETERAMAMLEKKYAENRDKWVSEIVSDIINA